MKDLSRRPVQQLLQAQEVLTLEFFIRKCPAVFQTPAASNEQFVFRLSCRKFAGFHGQQFGRFSLNLVIQILFFGVFYGLKPNIHALVLP